MEPRLLHVGKGKSPVVVVDGFTGRALQIVELAAAMAPFPQSQGSYYPGLRRVIGPGDAAAYAYAEGVLEAAAPFIGGAFDLDGFDWLEASFSMVTAPPETLQPPQRAPHFDSPDPRHIAVLHYLSDTPGSGTAFFRQRATGIERVDADNQDRFVAAARPAAMIAAGYIAGSDDHYDEIGRVEARADRLVIYQGSLLHSGIIPAGMGFSSDPRLGRLTANLFVRGR